MPQRTIQYSIITPSRGDRPKALFQALESVESARKTARLAVEEIEILIGFDGPDAIRVPLPPYGRFFDFPPDRDYGNAIRNGLLKTANGRRILFLDDDNAITPETIRVYNTYPDAELIIGRIDTQRTLGVPFLPRLDAGREIVRPTNIDPLCICATRDLVVTRCGGWKSSGGYEADYLNILRYTRRAKPIKITHELVGIYDAGIGLDHAPLSSPQKMRLRNRRTS